MTSELSHRVAIAWDEVRLLGVPEANVYISNLRSSDPEVAGILATRWERQHRETVTLPSPQARHESDSHTGCGEPTTCDANQGADGSTQSQHVPPPDTCAELPAPGGLLGRYRLLRVIGRGGFGEVWQAYDPILQKDVAVKTPRRSESGSSRSPAIFLDEARKAASLRHPAIVQVHDVCEGEEGWYIISEFIDGVSLGTRMDTGRLSFERSAQIIATIAAALHVAHLAGLVHRDVKPANILLDRSGAAYLTDFGLAVREDEQLAQRSKVSGTFAYMSPEQVSGDTHLMDGRSDIYSLGAVLYELLTGRRLFRAGEADEYRELILRRQPRPPRSLDDTIPEELERICLKCLSKEVQDRYATAQDLANSLNAWLAPAPQTPARPAAIPGWVKAGSLAAILLVGIAVLGSAFLATGLNVTPRANQTVKKLIWPGDSELSQWEVLPESNQLRVTCHSTSLLQLGQADAPDWEFSAKLTQVSGVGRTGLFFGYHKDPRTGAAGFEVIRFLVVRDKAFLERQTNKYRSDLPAGSDGLALVNARLPHLGRENTIRLVVRGSQLSEVYLNGTIVPELTNIPSLPLLAPGPFGVFNEDSDVVVSSPLFNDQSIRLIGEEKSVSVENAP